MQTILVVGATGTVGAPVAQRLLADGFAVRLLVRDIDRARAILGREHGYQYAPGQLGDRCSLDRALRGCFGVHVSVSGGSDPATLERVELHGTAMLADLAAEHGLHRLTYVSGFLAREDLAAAHLESRVKLAAERAIARPSRLTSRPATGGYRVGTRLPYAASASISRADLAAFLLDQLDDHAATRGIVEITT